MSIVEAYLMNARLSRMGVSSPLLLQSIFYCTRKSNTPLAVSPFLRIWSVTPWSERIRIGTVVVQDHTL